MGINKGASICPLDDNTVFVIRKHGTENERIFTPSPNCVHPLSRQASIQSYQSRSSNLTLDEDLEALRAANMVFIRHVQRPKLCTQNKYTILNTIGETLFYAVELKDEEPQPQAEKPKKSPQKEKEIVPKLLKFVVVNSQGEEVFDVSGNPGEKGRGAHASIKRDSTVLGNVAQINRLSCTNKVPSYAIESPDGRTIQKVLAMEKSVFRLLLRKGDRTEDFNVCSPDGSITKAKISRQRNAITLEEYSEADTYAVSFHTTDMDGKLKALLIGAVLMLDVQLSESSREREKGWRDYKSLVSRLIFCAMLVGMLVLLIVVIAEDAMTFQKEKVKRFPGQVPPP